MVSVAKKIVRKSSMIDDLSQIAETPMQKLLIYTGDTNPNWIDERMRQEIPRFKKVLTECTFLGDDCLDTPDHTHTVHIQNLVESGFLDKKKLILTHLSSRYYTNKKEAMLVNLPFDFMC
jgi:ribonuclease BN (tRNA processing enzyme)